MNEQLKSLRQSLLDLMTVAMDAYGYSARPMKGERSCSFTMINSGWDGRVEVGDWEKLYRSGPTAFYLANSSTSPDDCDSLLCFSMQPRQVGHPKMFTSVASIELLGMIVCSYAVGPIRVDSNLAQKRPDP